MMNESDRCWCGSMMKGRPHNCIGTQGRVEELLGEISKLRSEVENAQSVTADYLQACKQRDAALLQVDEHQIRVAQLQDDLRESNLIKDEYLAHLNETLSKKTEVKLQLDEEKKLSTLWMEKSDENEKLAIERRKELQEKDRLLSEKDRWIKALETRIDTMTDMLVEAGAIKLSPCPNCGSARKNVTCSVCIVKRDPAEQGLIDLGFPESGFRDKRNCERAVLGASDVRCGQPLPCPVHG